jgi:hypothetical protein
MNRYALTIKQPMAKPGIDGELLGVGVESLSLAKP